MYITPPSQQEPKKQSPYAILHNQGTQAAMEEQTAEDPKI